jgi:hypothetical protein
MSNFNEYNIRQVGERIRLPDISVSIFEKKKEDGTLVRWAQLSRFNPKTEKYENFSIFKDDLKLLGLKTPELLTLASGWCSTCLRSSRNKIHNRQTYSPRSPGHRQG